MWDQAGTYLLLVLPPSFISAVLVQRIRRSVALEMLLEELLACFSKERSHVY